MGDAPATCRTLGILGGGQLGRMLSVAASRLGIRTHVFEAQPDPPAGHVADAVTTASFEDKAALRAFAESVDVITLEWENVPVEALELLEEIRPVRPGSKALRISQDRMEEKMFLQDIGLNIAPYAVISGLGALRGIDDWLGGASAIIKTVRFGYDGKGQARTDDFESLEEAYNAATAAASRGRAIVEAVVEFEREISVIAARGLDGAVVCFDPGENVHRDGILRTTTVPAQISAGQRADAALIAGKILNALDYVGVIGVELFVTKDGLLVNEIAPRVHNSGHWTQQGCSVDQFEQHVRAVAGWPLGDGSRHADVVMENLIGDDVERAPEIAAEPGASLHLYGKAETRPGRKMGHVNRIVRSG